ncbi:unnamed protein product [Prunus brigantina]
MNGFFLQSTTTPRKACKGIENDRGLTGLAWWSLIGASMAGSIGIWDREAWWFQSTFGIVKLSGVTPINPSESRPPP